MKQCAYCDGVVADEALECPGCAARQFVEAPEQPRIVYHIGDDRVLATDILPPRGMKSELAQDYQQQLYKLDESYQHDLSNLQQWFQERLHDLQEMMS
jgi:hypothetical protein